jgi:Fic family protein
MPNRTAVRYTAFMEPDRPLSADEVAAARQGRLEAMKLQEIEGNPLTAEDVAMFEMFEREGWSDERCRAFILAQAKRLAAVG